MKTPNYFPIMLAIKDNVSTKDATVVSTCFGVSYCDKALNGIPYKDTWSVVNSKTEID